MARRRNSDTETGKALVALAVVGSILGWFEAARDFINERLPLFVALGVAICVLLALIAGRRIAASRARAAPQRLLDAQVGSTDGMSGPDFERLVARLLQRDGFTEVRIPGGAGDLGADVLGRSTSGRKVVVQCKRFSPHRMVSSPDMQKFLGTCFHEHRADEAWFVTTTRFSKAARDLGARRGERLVDRTDLAGWMARDASVQTVSGANRGRTAF